jgi:hypothetical protein
MANEPDDTLSPQHAEAVWRRAAQLQAQAAQRLEERSRALARGASADPQPHAFTHDEVRAAALEAGIAPEYVALALAQLGEDAEPALPPRRDRAATRLLGTTQRTLVVSRTVQRPVAQVYEAMQRVLPGHPWYLSLRESSGDPLAGGTLVFDVPGYVEAHQTALAMHAMAVDLKQLQVMLRPLPAGEACEVVVSAGLQRSVRRNFYAAGWFTGIMGGMGAGGGVAVAAAAGVAGAVLALPAAAGAAVLAGVTAAGYRAGYRHSLRKLGEVLESMLQAVDVHARTGGGFTPAPRPPAPGDASGDGGASATAALVASTIA